MKRTMTNVTVSVVLALVCLALFASSAQAIQIRAETGETLPSSIIVDESLTVMITDDAGTAIDGVAEGARVRYILPADDGTPIPVDVGADGKTVNPYQPPMTGVLNIAVSYGTTLMASQTVNVVTAETQALDRVEISPDHADLLIDDTNQFAATCYATGGGVIGDCTVEWTCDSTDVGTIDLSSGLFTACGVGTATVTVTAEYEGATKTDTAIVNVSAPTETVSVDGDNFTEVSIDAGTAADIAVNGTFDNNVTGSINITPISDPEATVNYEFTGNDVALIGLTVTPDANITAELANGNDTIRIEMCYNEAELASKNINPSTLAIWRFDGTEWVKMVAGNAPCVDNGRQDTCVWIEVNNLSVFALAGIVTTSSDNSDNSGGGGGGSGTYPPGWLETPTATVTATQSSSSTTPDTTATAERTASQAATKKPTVKATTAQASGSGATPDAPEKKGLPGFEGAIAITGLLSIAYVMVRRKR